MSQIFFAFSCFSFFLFFSEPFWLAHHLKKEKRLKALQNRSFYWKVESVPPLLTHLHVKGGTALGKAYRIKVWFHWEHIREHFGNFGKPLGTKKFQHQNPPHPQKKKTMGLLGAYCIASLAKKNFLFLHFVCHHFWPRLMEEKGRIGVHLWIS